MTFAQGFFDYFRTCPLLKGKVLHFDYSSARAGEYFIDTSAPDTEVRKYQHGAAIWQKPIYFCMNASFGDDAGIQIGNKVQLEDFRAWIEAQNFKKAFPTLPDNCYPASLQCTTDGVAMNNETNTIEYQIQLILEYLRKPKH